MVIHIENHFDDSIMRNKNSVTNIVVNTVFNYLKRSGLRWDHPDTDKLQTCQPQYNANI